MNFKVGQKVVCVQIGTDYLKFMARMCNFDIPVKDCIYTVSGLITIDGRQAVTIVELNHGPSNGYISTWFAPIDDNFADEVLSKVKEEIKKEELVPVN